MKRRAGRGAKASKVAVPSVAPAADARLGEQQVPGGLHSRAFHCAIRLLHRGKTSQKLAAGGPQPVLQPLHPQAVAARHNLPPERRTTVPLSSPPSPAAASTQRQLEKEEPCRQAQQQQQQQGQPRAQVQHYKARVADLLKNTFGVVQPVPEAQQQHNPPHNLTAAGHLPSPDARELLLPRRTFAYPSPPAHLPDFTGTRVNNSPVSPLIRPRNLHVRVARSRNILTQQALTSPQLALKPSQHTQIPGLMTGDASPLSLPAASPDATDLLLSRRMLLSPVARQSTIRPAAGLLNSHLAFDTGLTPARTASQPAQLQASPLLVLNRPGTKPSSLIHLNVLEPQLLLSPCMDNDLLPSVWQMPPLNDVVEHTKRRVIAAAAAPQRRVRPQHVQHGHQTLHTSSWQHFIEPDEEPWQAKHYQQPQHRHLHRPPGAQPFQLAELSPPALHLSLLAPVADQRRQWSPDSQTCASGFHIGEVSQHVSPREPTAAGLVQHPQHAPAEACGSEWLCEGSVVPGAAGAGSAHSGAHNSSPAQLEASGGLAGAPAAAAAVQYIIQQQHQWMIQSSDDLQHLLLMPVCELQHVGPQPAWPGSHPAADQDVTPAPAARAHTGARGGGNTGRRRGGSSAKRALAFGEMPVLGPAGQQVMQATQADEPLMSKKLRF